VRWPVLAACWHQSGQVLVGLAVPDEQSLERISFTLDLAEIPHVRFTEPDLDGQLTALAAPGTAARLLSHLPLLLREEVRQDD
jgi:hypothetical protein